jgi:hypothetical protein
MAIQLYNDGSKESAKIKRKKAVEAALEVIKEYGHNSAEKLSYQMDRLPDYGPEHLRVAKPYHKTGCIELFYDLDDDGKADILEFRRTTTGGCVSPPILVMWDKNKNMSIEPELGEVYNFHDPSPEWRECPPMPDKKKGL